MTVSTSLSGRDIAGSAAEMKESLTSSFGGIHARVSETAESLDSLISLMEPYVEYFFSGGKGTDSFLGDIVFPAEKDLNAALQAAVVIMNGDEQIHETIYTSLSRTMLLQSYVDKIVALMESMEIYALNTMIMSAKSGLEGAALTTISNQMAVLSRRGNELSETFGAKMDNLHKSLSRFQSTGQKIEMMHESSLTVISLSSSSMFKNLVDQFSGLSGEVLSVYGMIKAVSSSVRQITAKFQYEDLLRQDLEKMLYAADLSTDSDECLRFAESSGSSTHDSTAFFYQLAHDKLEDISDDVLKLHNELKGAIDEVAEVITVFESMIQNGDSSEKGNGTSADSLLSLCARLETLKGNFGSYIESVLICKNDLFSEINSIDAEMRDFNSFFTAILDISRKFQNIILMTRIEIARHDHLHLLLEGTLSDVMTIPVDIRSVIDELMPLYDDISSNLSGSVSLYRERYLEQKAILDGCVDTIKNVSVQIYESKKYHDDFIRESDECTRKVRSFIGFESSALTIFATAAEQLADLLKLPPEFESADSLNAHMIDSFRSQFENSAAGGDYRSMMLLSLVAEYSGGKTEGGTIDFF